VSKESFLKLKYLQASIGSEFQYLNLEVHDYGWKISKLHGFSSNTSLYGGVINSYFKYIEKTYNNESYLDLEKEGEALNCIHLYYKDIKNIMNEGSADINNEAKFKEDIIRKEGWIKIVSSLNKYDQDFSTENRNKFIPIPK
jgi:hypothetical protein